MRKTNHGEVKTGWVSPEEIRHKYGPPLSERIPEEEILRLKNQGMNHEQIAERFRVETKQISGLLLLYRQKKKKGVEDMTGRKPKYPHITKKFLEKEFEAGKSAMQIEREQDMPTGTLHPYMKRLGVENPNNVRKKVERPDVEKKREQPKVPSGTVPMPANEIESSSPSPTQDDRESKPDTINHPSHYTAGKVECIDAIESATGELKGIEAVCTASVIKYVWRWKQKNGVEDLEKARWYLDRLIGTKEGEAE